MSSSSVTSGCACCGKDLPSTKTVKTTKEEITIEKLDEDKTMVVSIIQKPEIIDHINKLTTTSTKCEWITTEKWDEDGNLISTDTTKTYIKTEDI